MHDLIPAFATTIRHVTGDTTVPEALQALGWHMPTASCKLTRQKMDGANAGEILLVWRNPQEVLALCVHSNVLDNPFDQLTIALAGGKSATAIAADMSSALAVLELSGPHLEDWLSRLVDAASIPPAASASGARLGDVSVLLVRPELTRAWLVFERPLLPYITNWLTYAYEGADVKTT